MAIETNQLTARTFVQLTKRAESADLSTLVQTFVDIGTLLPSISTEDNQIIFGRRGTGKTHALVYAVEETKRAGALAIYVDLRTAGSSGGLYSDPRLTLQERATRLLIDVLEYVHTTLLSEAIGSTNLDLSILGPLLDALGASATEVRIIGDVALETQSGATQSDEQSSGLNLTLAQAPSITVQGANKTTGSTTEAHKVSASGALRHHLHFGTLSRALAAIVEALPEKKLLIVLDEWVSIPYELQPYLADLLRRAFFPVKGIVVKVAAIEQRSSFKIKGEHRDYIGIELGGDVSTAVNLDDFMVFENDESQATRFLRELLYKHYKAELPDSEIASAEALVKHAFTQMNAFEEFVKAAEGVPRDAINILSVAAQKASEEKISIPTFVRLQELGMRAERKQQSTQILRRKSSFTGSLMKSLGQENLGRFFCGPEPVTS